MIPFTRLMVCSRNRARVSWHSMGLRISCPARRQSPPVPEPEGEPVPVAAAPDPQAEAAPPDEAPPPASPQAQSAPAAPSAASAPTAAPAADGGFLPALPAATLVADTITSGFSIKHRYYCVWVVPDQAVDIRGIHTSGRAEGRAAWWHILRFLPQQSYLYSDGVRLSGQFYDLESAVTGYTREAPRHQAPVPPRVFVWP